MPCRGRVGGTYALSRARSADLCPHEGAFHFRVSRILGVGALDSGWLAHVERVAWRQAFGELTGNTDMHLHNLSFFLDGVRPGPLAPAYDMAPMRFAPRAGDLLELELAPRLSPQLASAWPSAREAARVSWRRVVADQRVSPGFRALAGRCVEVVEGLEAALRLLPRD